MSTLLSIDPGYAARGRGCALAFFEGRTLTRVFFLRPEDACHEALQIGADHVVWECPQVDSRTRGSVPALVQLAAVGGTLAGMFAGSNRCDCEPVLPSTWKGSTPKPVHHARMWRVLQERERELLGGSDTFDRIEAAQRKGALTRWAHRPTGYYPASWLMHNLLDAVGIGFWSLHR